MMLKENVFFSNRLINIFFSFVLGLITTTSRKLDREHQSEHILEVSFIFKANNEKYINMANVITGRDGFFDVTT